MRHAATIVFLGAILLGPALAQQPAPTEPPLAQRSIKITAEQGHSIKQIVRDSHPPSGSGAEVKVGEKLPDGVTLQEFPALAHQKVPALKGHKYAIYNDQVVIVSTADGTIADIL